MKNRQIRFQDLRIGDTFIHSFQNHIKANIRDEYGYGGAIILEGPLKGCPAFFVAGQLVSPTKHDKKQQFNLVDIKKLDEIKAAALEAGWVVSGVSGDGAKVYMRPLDSDNNREGVLNYRDGTIDTNLCFAVNHG